MTPSRFSGSRLAPGETIDLVVHQTFPGGADDRTLDTRRPTRRRRGVSNSDMVITEADRNTTMTVTATGESSGSSATSTFGDAIAFVVGQKKVNATANTGSPSAVTSLSTGNLTSVPVAGHLLVVIAVRSAVATPSRSTRRLVIQPRSTKPVPRPARRRASSTSTRRNGCRSVCDCEPSSTTGATISIAEYSGIVGANPFDGATRAQTALLRRCLPARSRRRRAPPMIS